MVGPEPEAWLEADEGERTEMVYRYHKRRRLRAGNLRLHAVIHTTVENQLAEAHAGARAALERLVGEGLDRHEAIHAIGSLVARHIHRSLRGVVINDGEYDKELAELTVESWHRMNKEE
jgi:hypothetical protein